MYLSVKEVKPLDEYKLLLTFENGELRLSDMSPYLDKGIFRELKDISLFKINRVKRFMIMKEVLPDLCESGRTFVY